MSAERQHRYQRFWDDRLSAPQNKAAELALNGFSIEEIAEEMQIEPSSVKQYVSCARHVVAIPYFKTPRRTDAVPIERLVHIRATLRANGIKHGITRIIAERCGMTANCVSVRLWRYDNERRGT